MIVKLGDDEIAGSDQAAQHAWSVSRCEGRAVQYEDARHVVGCRGGDGDLVCHVDADQRIGPDRLQRMHDADMRHAADRRQHVARDAHAPPLFLPEPPDQMGR